MSLDSNGHIKGTHVAACCGCAVVRNCGSDWGFLHQSLRANEHLFGRRLQVRLVYKTVLLQLANAKIMPATRIILCTLRCGPACRMFIALRRRRSSVRADLKFRARASLRTTMPCTRWSPLDRRSARSFHSTAPSRRSALHLALSDIPGRLLSVAQVHTQHDAGTS